MERQQCPNCSAPMILITKRDGTSAFKCEYCGSQVDILTHKTSDRVFAFINRVADAFDAPAPETKITPKQKKTLVEKMDEIERAAKALDQRRRQLADKLDKWGF